MRFEYLRTLAGVFLLAVGFLSSVPLAAQEKSGTGSASVAVFQGKEISRQELEKAAADDLEKLEMQLLQFKANHARSRHQIYETALNRMIEERVLDAAAAKKGTTREELLAKELNGKVKDPTPEQVDEFYLNNKSRIGRTKEEVAGQIQQYLKKEHYNRAKSEFLEGLKKEYGVRLSLGPFRMEVPTAGRPSTGPENAPVTIVEFSDFQCPYCVNLTATLRQVREKYGNQIRLVFRNFPLSQIHNYAQKAAEASYCAAEQGRFWELHDLMFAAGQQLSEKDLLAGAAKLQLNVPEFGTCLSSGRYAARVKEDVREGASLGVSGTPALFINGRFLSGAQSLQDLSKIIDEELQASGPSVKLASASNPTCGDDTLTPACGGR